MARAKYSMGKDGYYSTLVWDGTYTENGNKHRKQLRTKKSSKELERMVQHFREDVENRNAVVSTNITVYDYALRWIRAYKAGREINTLAMYDNIIKKHLHKLQSVRLTDFRQTHFLLTVNDKSPYLQRQIYMTVKQLINTAIRERLLPAASIDDIFGGYNPPRQPKTTRRPLSSQEIEAVKNAVLKPMDKAFLWIIYGCGLRREEALALTRFDISLERRILTVNKALVFDGNNPCLKGTKSENGVRELPVPVYLAEFLRDYLSSLSGTYLFSCRGRENMTHSSYVKMWNRIRSAICAADPKCLTSRELTAHMFRHNYCTTLCYQIPRVSVKRIAQLMGDSEKMVLNVYSHILAEKEDAVGAVENAVGNL